MKPGLILLDVHVFACKKLKISGCYNFLK